jgi:hypothetical protein
MDMAKGERYRFGTCQTARHAPVGEALKQKPPSPFLT